jgi:hypothetical protein
MPAYFDRTKGFRRSKKYCCYSPSSLLVVKLISVERMDSVFLFLLLVVFSGFNFLLSALISSKMKPKDIFPYPDLASKPGFFCF